VRNLQIEAALTKEQGVTFVVIGVKSYIFRSPAQREEALGSLSAAFPGAEPILMHTNTRNVEYFGRPDIVRFLSNVDPLELPWKKLSVTFSVTARRELTCTRSILDGIDLAEVAGIAAHD
jgi:hypothetical protein